MSSLPEKQEAMRQRVARKRLAAKKDVTRQTLTDAQAEALLIAQRGRCAICNKKIHLSVYTELWDERVLLKEATAYVDHDHKTGRVRGLLCHHCNSGLGFFADMTDVMLRAIEYLKQAATFWDEQDADQ